MRTFLVLLGFFSLSLVFLFAIYAAIVNKEEHKQHTYSTYTLVCRIGADVTFRSSPMRYIRYSAYGEYYNASAGFSYVKAFNESCSVERDQ